MTERRLVILRHAKAEHTAGVADRDRALTDRGRRQATEVGRALAAADLAPDYVICSAARRTHETWDLVRAELPGDSTVDVSATLYTAGPDTALDLAGEVPPETRTLLLVGHNPTMAQLAAAFAGPEGPGALGSFPTASVAVVDVAVDWRYLAPGTGTVHLLATRAR